MTSEDESFQLVDENGIETVYQLTAVICLIRTGDCRLYGPFFLLIFLKQVIFKHVFC